jgi:hypothetical protein
LILLIWFDPGRPQPVARPTLPLDLRCSIRSIRPTCAARRSIRPTCAARRSIRPTCAARRSIRPTCAARRSIFVVARRSILVVVVVARRSILVVVVARRSILVVARRSILAACGLSPIASGAAVGAAGRGCRRGRTRL